MEYVAKKSLKEFSTLSMLAITGCYQVYLLILPMIGGWSYKREVRPIKTELCLLGRCWTSDINNPDQYQDVPRISTVAARKLSHHHCTPPHELMVSYQRTHGTEHQHLLSVHL